MEDINFSESFMDLETLNPTHLKCILPNAIGLGLAHTGNGNLLAENIDLSLDKSLGQCSSNVSLNQSTSVTNNFGLGSYLEKSDLGEPDNDACLNIPQHLLEFFVSVQPFEIDSPEPLFEGNIEDGPDTFDNLSPSSSVVTEPASAKPKQKRKLANGQRNFEQPEGPEFVEDTTPPVPPSKPSRRRQKKEKLWERAEKDPENEGACRAKKAKDRRDKQKQEMARLKSDNEHLNKERENDKQELDKLKRTTLEQKEKIEHLEEDRNELVIKLEKERMEKEVFRRKFEEEVQKKSTDGGHQPITVIDSLKAFAKDIPSCTINVDPRLAELETSTMTENEMQATVMLTKRRRRDC